MKTLTFYIELYNLGKSTLLLSNDNTKVEVKAPNGTNTTRHGSYAYGTYFSVLLNGVEVKTFKQLASTEKYLLKLITDLGLTNSVTIGEDGQGRFATTL